MKNIWFISKYGCSSLYGAPSRQFLFSTHLSELGHNVTFIGSRSIVLDKYPNLKFRNHRSIEQNKNFTDVIINGPKIKLGLNMNRILSWIIFEFRLLIWGLFFKSKKPDVIIASSLSILTFLSAIFFSRFYNCKLVLEVRDIWPLTLIESKAFKKDNLFIKLLSAIEKYSYNEADAIVGTMGNLKEHVGELNYLNQRKVFYIPMGFNQDLFEDNIPGLIKLPIDEDFLKKNFIVGYAGTFGKMNCIDQILECANILKNKSIVFLLLGDGPLRSIYMEYAKKNEMNNVFFIDKVPKKLVITFLKSCHILINPWINSDVLYKYGVSPNKWIDYMYSGRPVIVSLSGYRNIINEAECGEFVDAGNPLLLAQAIEKYSQMPRNTLDQMGMNGQYYLIRNLNYKTLTLQYDKIISSLF